MKPYKLRQTKFGSLEIFPKPTEEELEQYYKDKYFQEGAGSYKKIYDDEELHYLENEGVIAHHTLRKYGMPENTLLDIGCGQGYFTKFFASLDWQVTCCDYSVNGLRQHNPGLEKFLLQGNIFETIAELIGRKKTYGLLNLDNVLEHVTHPEKLLKQMYSLMDVNSIARIEVPNDFSDFQKLLIEKGFSDETWIHPLEHLSYFDADSLRNILENCGFECLSVQANFPIEQFLVARKFSYYDDRALGKDAHYVRIVCTNYLIDKSPAQYIAYSEAAAKLAFGRLLTAYVRKRI